ncbi:hypothetical protein OKW41_008475 [Paraburkholderia sp. UCT70]|uniref:hypothetical protein n=1 Tax=Paraburkholderia sp. UCT70 TaxID=2991068 RepID=UPI003D260AE3
MDRQLGQLYNAALKTISNPPALKNQSPIGCSRATGILGACATFMANVSVNSWVSLGSKPLIPVASEADKP